MKQKKKIKASKIGYLFFTTLSYFIIFGTVTFIIIKIWGYSIQLEVAKNLFYENILPKPTVIHNEIIPYLSISTIFTVFLYIVKGFVYSYIINTFFCKKILNPIIIGQTMQHTVMTLIKYIMILMFFIIGLFTAGIQGIIFQLGALMLALSFALKEPVADFISYFIIIIQCPIRVGDFVRINKTVGGQEPDIVGIVREIGSRTTIIRQKNSQTIIIPNSIIITRILYNWTYYQYGFTAIEDFVITIEKTCNPEEMRNLLIKTVESYPVIIKNPKPLVRCSDITNYGYEFLIRAYITPERAPEQWDIASYLRIIIIKKLEEEGISFGIGQYNIKIQEKIEEDAEKLSIQKSNEEKEI